MRSLNSFECVVDSSVRKLKFGNVSRFRHVRASNWQYFRDSALRGFQFANVSWIRRLGSFPSDRKYIENAFEDSALQPTTALGLGSFGPL